MGNFNDMHRCSCCQQMRNVESMEMLGGEWVCSACRTEGDISREVRRILAMSDEEILARDREERAASPQMQGRAGT